MFRVIRKSDAEIFTVYHVKQDGLIFFLIFEDGVWNYWNADEFLPYE